MSSIVHAGVEIQLSPEQKSAVPSWFEEVIVMAHVLREHHLLESLSAHVRFSRARMGTYELIDFVVILLGYALSGERTLHDFYQQLADVGDLLMALFERSHLPHRATLSRFLAALTPECVDQLRHEVLADRSARPWPQVHEAGWWDRTGRQWVVFDVDGTRAVARQRALPQAAHLPPAHRRHEQVCAKGYTGRKRGEVVRTRTTVLNSATGQWMGTFSGAGNGDRNGELARALATILASRAMEALPQVSAVVRLDGAYGSGAYVASFQAAQLAFVVRGTDYGILQDPAIQARLAFPADAESIHAESGMHRWLYDCVAVRLPSGPVCRVIIATHPASNHQPAVGVSREGVVYELFYTDLPQAGFLASDVLAMYQHRGAFEQVLADEDQEQEPDRWCSHTPSGQEFWQLLSQWVWNLRLEWGQLSHPTPLRTTLFAAALEPGQTMSPQEPEAAGQSGQTAFPQEPEAVQAPEDRYALASPSPPSNTESASPPVGASSLGEPTEQSPRWARAARPGMFAGADFTRQANGTVCCPAGQTLTLRERRQEPDGTLRLYYMASATSCDPCPWREQCLRKGQASHFPRRVSLLERADGQANLSASPAVIPRAIAPHEPLPPPLPAGSEPILLKDWGRCCTRREWMRLVRTHLVEIEPMVPSAGREPEPLPTVLLTRAQRAHWRLGWQERLARNAASSPPLRWTLHLHGVPPLLAALLQPSR